MAIRQECETPGCTNEVVRYPSEVKRGIKTHCSTACAGRHSAMKNEVSRQARVAKLANAADLGSAEGSAPLEGSSPFPCTSCEKYHEEGKRRCVKCGHKFASRKMTKSEREAQSRRSLLKMRPMKVYRGWPLAAMRAIRREVSTCQICGKECGSGKSTALDHDHETDRNRGLLCMSCNTKLGWYERYSEEVDRYLAAPPFFKQSSF